MRLEPVLLAAPDPPPSLATRRAFLFGGAMFATGMTLGGACGYAIGVRRQDGVAGGEQGNAALTDEELKPSGDAELDELRRLAVKAPIEELVKNRTTLLRYVGQTYRNDRWLWLGVRRLADFVLQSPSYAERRMAALSLIQVIQLGDHDSVGNLGDYIPALKRIK